MAMVASLLPVAGAVPTQARGEGTTESRQPAVVVMDFSGSMNKADADSHKTTRLAAAKSAVGTVLSSAPKDSDLGLMVFGARDSSCGDVQTLNPVGPFDAKALTAKVNGLKAVGNTPIGPALKHAADELKGVDGPRSIILVSDGEANCTPPDPCDEAKILASQGVDVKVHTIGFRLAGNDKATSMLRCIADATGGTYTDADDASQLQRALTSQTYRALEGYEVAGTRVRGGPTETTAERLEVGQYVTRMPGGPMRRAYDDTTVAYPNRRYFSVPHRQGWRTIVTATLVRPTTTRYAETNLDAHLDVVRVASEGGAKCASMGTTGTDAMTSSAVDLTSITDLDEDVLASQCGNSPWWIVGVNRHGKGWADQELDVEITVTMRKEAVSGLHAAADPGSASPAAVAEPRSVTGGSSFNDAPVLQPGETISDDVNTNERRYFKVPVRYGQNLDVRAELPRDGQRQKPTLAGVSVVALNPLRETLSWGESTMTLSEMGARTDGRLERPILPQHLDTPDESYGIAGMHYIVVGRDSTSKEWKDAKAPVGFTLTPTVWGEPVDVGTVLITTPEQFRAEFERPVASASPRRHASVSTTPTPAQAVPSTQPVVEPRRHTGAWVGLGIAVAVVVAGTMWLVIRRSRS